MNNIINYIKSLSENEKIQELLIETIGKLLLKQDNIENFIKENEDKIIHIRDWITAVVNNNEQWKKPRVLTLDALNNVANKYFQKQNNKLQIIELDEKHEKIVADLGGYYVVQMLTPEVLDKESKVMQHCIGHGGYDRRLQNKNYQYLSLRDKFNKAHVTLEIKNNKISQLQGKQNKDPKFKYLEKIVPWLVEQKIEEIPWYKIKKYYDNEKWVNFNEIELIENIDYKLEKNIDGFKIYRNVSQKFCDNFYYNSKFNKDELIYFNKRGRMIYNLYDKEFNKELHQKVVDYLTEKKYKFSYFAFM